MSILLIGELSDDEYESWRTHLAEHLPRNETLVLAGESYDPDGVEVAVVANAPVGSLSRLPKLRFIQSLWAGVDRLMADRSVPAGVPIARLVDPVMTQEMVECAVGHVSYLHRRMPEYLRQQAQRFWRQLPQPTAASRSIGVLGLGQMGSAVARALAALGFPVRGWSRRPKEGSDIDSHSGPAGLMRVAASSQILINLLPLTAETSGILNAPLFQRLPERAAVVNLGRGGHLVEADLLAALEAGRVGHAVLDVFVEEPLPLQHPFWTHPQITVLPHVAAHTDLVSASRIACANIAAFRAGRSLTGLVSRSDGY